MGILAIIIAVVALVSVQSIKGRIDKLEQSIKNAQTSKGENFAEHVQEKIILEHGDEVTEKTAIIDNPVITPQKNAFAEWLKEDWLMKLGALLFVIGIGWFVTYAFMNNWIGPMGRITLGILAGAIVLALGTWRMRSFKNQGAVLVALGVAIVAMTVVAAREIYGFFTPISELGIIFLTTSFAAFASVKYSSRALVALSIVLGYIAPLLVGGIDNKFLFFAYLLVVSSATLWIAAITEWRFLAPISLVFIAWFSFFGGIPDSISILFIFAALYFATNIAAVIKSEKISSSDVFTAVGLSILLVFWIFVDVSAVWQSLFSAGWAVMFVFAAFVVFKMTKRKEPVFIYSGIAVALLGVATAMELSSAVLTLAYIYEITALVFITALVTGSIKQAQKMSLLFIVPMALSVESITSPIWQSSVIHKYFFVLLSFSIVTLALGTFFLTKKNTTPSSTFKKGTVLMFVVGVLYALILLWLSLHAVYSREIATTVALVVYTLLGIATYIKGKIQEIDVLRISGSILLAFVVLRLLLVEAWRLDMTGRIFIFLLIGALLVGTAFIGRSHKNK